MAKKNNKQKQQQKRVEKKREKRQAQSRPQRSSPSKGPELVSPAFIANCWSRSPLPAPEAFREAVESFDRWAEGFLSPELPADELLPARFDVVANISHCLGKAITQKVIDDIIKWLANKIDTPAQRQRVIATIEALNGTAWAPQNPLLGFLLAAWFAELPPNLSRWLSLWVDPEGDGPWPEIPAEVVRALADRDGIPFGEVDGPSAVLPLGDAYELLVAVGAIYGWTGGPPDHLGRLASASLWRWASHHETLAAGERARAAAADTHPRLTLFHAATELAKSICCELGDSWDEFVYDPQSPDWVLHLADVLVGRQRPEQAYNLLSGLAVRQPGIFDAHERLTELALALQLPRETVLDHAERGRAALLAQGDGVDPEIQEEYIALFDAHLARLGALA